MEGVVAPLSQAKVPPGNEGVAVRVAEFPSQMVTLFTVTAATGLTVTVPEAWFAVQPVTAGLTLMELPTKPPGFQVKVPPWVLVLAVKIAD
jgi:hypothetical protein